MSAIISDCGKYRYRLERELRAQPKKHPKIAIIMVNPSTADAEHDDATIRKLKAFGKANGWGSFVVGNLFAFRATDVKQLSKCEDPVGPDNDTHLHFIMSDCDEVIFAWGPLSKQPSQLRKRWMTVYSLAMEQGLTPKRIGETAKCGHPKHPLFLPVSSPLLDWLPPNA